MNSDCFLYKQRFFFVVVNLAEGAKHQTVDSVDLGTYQADKHLAADS